MQGAIPDQPISVKRRELDMEDYLDIVRRHRTWIIAPSFLGLVVGVMVAFLWPDTYTSTGQIRVVPPKVSSRLVASNLNEEMSQRVNAIYQDIISRDPLSNMIVTYNLYPDKRKRMPMEDVLEIMRKEIQPSPLRGLNTVVGGGRVFAFSVSFSYSDRRVAQRVCQDLISKFLDETSRRAPRSPIRRPISSPRRSPMPNRSWRRPTARSLTSRRATPGPCRRRRSRSCSWFRVPIRTSRIST